MPSSLVSQVNVIVGKFAHWSLYGYVSFWNSVTPPIDPCSVSTVAMQAC
jgi:hypothetical protein